MLLGTIGAGATVTFNTQFIPQFIVFRGAAGGDITGNVSGLINVEGDGVIFNLPTTAGFDAMANIHQYNLLTAQVAADGRVFQLTNGIVANKASYWTFTNTDAAAVNVYGWSKQKKGDVYFTYGTQAALQNSGTIYNKFAYLAIPAFGATDTMTITYNDGAVDANLSAVELRADSAYFQSVAQIAVDNINPARVKEVFYLPTATRDTFLMRYQAVAGYVNPNMGAV